MGLSPANKNFKRLHGITQEAWDARPYEPYTTGDLSPVRVAFTGAPDGGAFMLRCAEQFDGVLIHRFPIPGLDAPSVLAELRPNSAVLTGSVWHSHPTTPEAASNLITEGHFPGRIFNPRIMENNGHIARNKPSSRGHDHAGEHTELWHEHPNFAKYLFCGKETQTGEFSHTHQETFSRGPRDYISVKETEGWEVEVKEAGTKVRGDTLRWHIENRHSAGPLTPEDRTRLLDLSVEEAVQWVVDNGAFYGVPGEIKKRKREMSREQRAVLNENGSRYLGLREWWGMASVKELVDWCVENSSYGLPGAIKDRMREFSDEEVLAISTEHVHQTRPEVVGGRPEIAKRFDAHPWITEKVLKEAQVVWICMEQSLKADAIMCAGGVVVSCPSVTLWRAPELRAFIQKYLLGKTVILVCDNDWERNDLVRTQAFMMKGTMMKLGVGDVTVAAPPYLEGILDNDGEPVKIGVDDWLGEYTEEDGEWIGGWGGSLGSLVQIDAVPCHGLLDWVASHSTYRSDTLAGDASVLEQMSVLARDGRYSGSLKQLAELMGLNTAHSNVTELVECDEVECDVCDASVDMWERRVERTTKRLIGMGALHCDGDLSMRRSVFSGVSEWWEMPTLLLHAEVRATPVNGELVMDAISLPYDSFMQ